MKVFDRWRIIGLVAGAVFASGCATQMQQQRGPMAGASPCTFWPPPPSTSLLVVLDGGDHDETMTEVASRAEAILAGAGYEDLRWYPIGIDWRHGFAAVTRIERVEGEELTSPRRWSATDRDPPTLRWLAGERQPRFSQEGRYRALLISFTDLPLPAKGTADPWDDNTVMEGPGIPVDLAPTDLASRPKLPESFRWMLFSYEYDVEAAATDATFVEGIHEQEAAKSTGRSMAAVARVLGRQSREAL